MDGTFIRGQTADFRPKPAPLVAVGRLVCVLGGWSGPFDGFYVYYPIRRQPSQAFSLLLGVLRYRNWQRDRAVWPHVVADANAGTDGRQFRDRIGRFDTTIGPKSRGAAESAGFVLAI